jgi:hypothetical protein
MALCFESLFRSFAPVLLVSSKYFYWPSDLNSLLCGLLYIPGSNLHTVFGNFLN